MLLRTLFASTLILTFATDALAEPIFKNVASSLDLASYEDEVLVMPDSTRPGIHYLLPQSFTNQGGLDSPLTRDHLSPVLHRSNKPDGSAVFRFRIFPKIGAFDAFQVMSTLTTRHEHDRTFNVAPLEFIESNVNLNGVPPSLIERVEVRTVTFTIDVRLPRFPNGATVPPGYVYEIDLTSKSPDTLQAALTRIGAKGSVTVGFLGYADGAPTTGAPSTIRTGVPVDARFDSVVFEETP